MPSVSAAVTGPTMARRSVPRLTHPLIFHAQENIGAAAMFSALSRHSASSGKCSAFSSAKQPSGFRDAAPGRSHGILRVKQLNWFFKLSPFGCLFWAWNGVWPWQEPSVIDLGGVLTAESAVELMGSPFSGGSGLSRGEARRRRRAWRALDGPEPPEVSSNMRARARRSEGVWSWRRPPGFSVFHEHRLWFPNPSILGRASCAFWPTAGTNSHSVVAAHMGILASSS